MEWLPFVVASLAVYRLSRMVAVEHGPGKIFTRLRAWVSTDFDQDGRPENFLGMLLGCPACLSVWCGLGVAVLLWLWPAAWIAMLPLALSGAATLALSREE